jgi:hypothetical protein
VKLSKFKEVVTRLVELERERNAYLDSCPTEVRTIFVETPYGNATGLQFDLLVQSLFGTILVEEVYWLLFDWQPDSNYGVELDGVQYTINTLDDFFAFIERGYGLVD